MSGEGRIVTELKIQKVGVKMVTTRQEKKTFKCWQILCE